MSAASCCPTCGQPTRSKLPLTRRQADLLKFLGCYRAEHGCAPSLVEMSDALGLVAKSAAHKLLLAQLEARGHVRRTHGGSRMVELL